MRARALSLALAGLTALAACRATQGYEGERRNAAEVALVLGRSSSRVFRPTSIAEVLRVDGERLGHASARLELLPGAHVLSVWCRRGGRSEIVDIELEAASGRTYRLLPVVEGERASVRVVEDE